MLRLALRSARAHWRRFVLTATAVVVGVAFVVAAFVLTDSLARSIRDLLRDTAGRSDIVVRAATGSTGGPGGVFGGSRAGVPAALLPELAAVPGVAVADGIVSGPGQLLDKGGRSGAFDFSLVSNWPVEPDLFGVRLASGRAPSGPDDVVIDAETAAERGLGLGDRVRVATRRGIVDARISGIAEQRGTGLITAASVLAFSSERAAELVGVPGWYSVVNIGLEPGARSDDVQSALRKVGGASVSVFSSEALVAAAQADIEEELTNFVGLLLGFAGVTLFVSAFLIWNTFTIVVAQRTRELALLRAVGASRRQVAASVIGEGLVVGAAASALGLGLGVLLGMGLQRLIVALGVALPLDSVVFELRTAVAGVVVGLGVTAVSVVGPARRATPVPPVAAIQSIDATPTRRSLGRPVVGSVLLGAGLVIGARALAMPTEPVDPRVKGVALGALLGFLGVAALARFLAGPIVSVLGAPARATGVAGRIAARNSVRNPRRTASTASALMIGLALVATTLVVGESVRTAIRGGLTRSVHAEVVVDSGSVAPFDAATIDAIAAAPGVAEAVPMSITRSDTVGAPGRLAMTTGDVEQMASVVDPEIVEGRSPRGADEMAVNRRWADDKGVELGQRLTLKGGDVTRTLEVVGVYQRRELYDDTFAPTAAVAGLLGVEPAARLVFVRTEPGADPARVAAELARVAASIPNSTAQVRADFVESRTGSVDIIISIVNVLLGFAVAVAALGIANTLALSVVERTRELGLLRAVGMSRRRMRRMVRLEGVLIGTFGGVLGLVVGVGFGAALVAALPAENAELTLPWARLAALAVLGSVLGIAAAALPARRAGRLDVLDAIAEE